LGASDVVVVVVVVVVLDEPLTVGVSASGGDAGSSTVSMM
jgi:hypothetical protein